MTHDEAERGRVVDQYVSGELTPAEAREFEEHFFACDRCFDEVQAAERMRTAVRDAAARGLLDEAGDDSAVGAWWRAPAFLISAAAAIVLAVAAGWLALERVPALRRELDAERRARQAVSVEAAPRRAELESQRATLEGRTAAVVEPNVPVAIVQTERVGNAAVTIAIPSGARHIVVWMEAVPAQYGRFRLEVAVAENGVVQTVDDLVPNAQGALAAAIPVLSPGAYRARLFETSTAARALVAEYRLNAIRSAH